MIVLGPFHLKQTFLFYSVTAEGLADPYAECQAVILSLLHSTDLSHLVSIVIYMYARKNLNLASLDSSDWKKM